jgi:hypothetical protein
MKYCPRMSIFQGWQAARTVLQIGRGGKKQNYRPKNINPLPSVSIVKTLILLDQCF